MNNKHIKSILVVIFVLTTNLNFAQESKTFSTLSEVLEYSKIQNYSFKNANYQSYLALLTKQTAIANVFNPKISTSAQAVNNITLPISYLPAEAFGGAPGTFKKIQIGQQYVSTFNILPQFDIINLSTIAQIKSAKINEKLIENQNKLNEQNLYDRINAVYFNILSFQAQKDILNENLASAESIFKIVSQKNIEGIARKQDLNEAEVNVISSKDKIEQLDANLKIQYQIFDLFFENKNKSSLSQNIWDFENDNQTLTTQNNLQKTNYELQTLFAMQELKSLKYQNYPILSFISSFNWQNLSNEYFFANKSNWQNFNFIGLKLGWDLPNVQRLSLTKSKQIQIKTQQNNEEHSKIETESKNNQLILEYEKSTNQLNNYKKIVELKKDTYNKNLNQFKENILPLDKLLISQNDLVMSKINLISVLTNVGFNKNKIIINNQF